MKRRSVISKSNYFPCTSKIDLSQSRPQIDKSYVIGGKTSSSSSPNEHSKINASGINFGAYLDADVSMENATPVGLKINLCSDED